MTLDALIMFTGALVAILPIMQGLPDSMLRPVLFILGVIIVVLGVVVRRRNLSQKAVARSAPASAHEHSTFVESAPVQDQSVPDTHESETQE